jgi:integrase
MNLTQLACDRLRPPTSGAAITYFDQNLPGFGIRVSPKGKKVWIAQYRVRGGKEVLETIAPMAVIPNVGDARQRARTSIMKAKEGINPVEERKQQKAATVAKAEADAFTFAKLVDRYLTGYCVINTRASTTYETKRLLQKAVAFFGDKPVHEIRKADVIEMVANRAPVTRQGTDGLVEANRVLAATRRAFLWAMANDIVTVDPTVGVQKPRKKDPSRDRVLTDDDVVAFWNGCDKLGWPFGPLFQLLLVTGQRRGEVGGMRWSELDLDNKVWHIPGERTKNKKAHDVHLSDLALEIINGLVKFKPQPNRPDFVFSTTGDTAVSGFHGAKELLDQHMDAVADYHLHDLRRTCTTGMARLGIAPHVADRVLNHTEGTIHGVAAVYNRFQYIDERKAALDAWSHFVEALVRPETAQRNVVGLRR